ncbi:UNVERIFIED_CONTAM: hypothetical protein B566_EDAN015874 [Ephemera danica]|nr:hypothetical protein B566_EDAN015874 [Ephemera danica]
MGVTVLHQFPISDNRSGPQTVDLLVKRIGALGAVQSGQFLVDCETYSSMPNLAIADPEPLSSSGNSSARRSQGIGAIPRENATVKSKTQASCNHALAGVANSAPP